MKDCAEFQKENRHYDMPSMPPQVWNIFGNGSPQIRIRNGIGLGLVPAGWGRATVACRKAAAAAKSDAAVESTRLWWPTPTVARLFAAVRRSSNSIAADARLLTAGDGGCWG
jgi:hypothetical protein